MPTTPERGEPFDLDGTVLDTAPDMDAALNAPPAQHRRATLRAAAAAGSATGAAS